MEMVEALPADCRHRSRTNSQYALLGRRAMPVHAPADIARHRAYACIMVYAAALEGERERESTHKSSTLVVRKRSEKHGR